MVYSLLNFDCYLVIPQEENFSRVTIQDITNIKKMGYTLPASFELTGLMSCNFVFNLTKKAVFIAKMKLLFMELSKEVYSIIFRCEKELNHRFINLCHVVVNVILFA